MNTWSAFSNHLLRSQFPDRCGQDIEGFFLPPALLRVPLVQPGTEGRWYEVQLSWSQLPPRENVAHWGGMLWSQVLLRLPSAHLTEQERHVREADYYPALPDLESGSEIWPQHVGICPLSWFRTVWRRRPSQRTVDFDINTHGHDVSSVEATSKPQATWITTDNQMKK